MLRRLSLASNSRRVVALSGLLVIFACGVPETAPTPVPNAGSIPAPSIEPVDAAAGSLAPRLTRVPDGGAILSWLEPDATGTALRWSNWTAGGWSTPMTIVSSPLLLPNAADMPGVGALGGGRLAAHWRETREPAGDGYDAKVSLSFDYGKTWEAPVSPHRDRSDVEHGFVAIFEASPPLADGGMLRKNSRPGGAGGASGESGTSFDLTGGTIADRFDRDITDIDAGIAWLDGREAATNPVSFSAQLMTTTLESGGAVGLGLEQVLDSRACECCPLAVARAGDVTLLAYRDRSDDEHRDISVLRRAPTGQWSDPVRVHDDAWQVMGCPVNGPALDATGSRAAIAWFTASQQDPRVLLSFSDDAGETWDEPQRIDSPADGHATGHAGVAFLPDGSVLVTHVARQDGSLVALASRVVRGSLPSPPVLFARNVVGIPQIVHSGDLVLTAWAERVPATADAAAQESRRLRVGAWRVSDLGAGS